MLTNLSVLLGLVFGFIAVTRFVSLYTSSGYASFNPSDRKRGWRGVISALLLTGVFTGFSAFINSSSKTLFTRRVDGLRLTDNGLKGSLQSWDDAVFLLFMGVGIYGVIKAGLMLDRSMKGDEDAAQQWPATFLGSILLINAETVWVFGKNTLNITF